MKKRWRALIIVLLVVIVFLAIIIVYFYNNDLRAAKRECGEHEKDRSKLYCLRDVAIEKNNEKICDELLDYVESYSEDQKKDLRDECLIGVAMKSLKWKTCEKITDELKGIHCIIDVAVLEQDLNLCQELSSLSWVEVCIRDVAIEKQDESLCEEITEERLQNPCFEKIGILKKDVDICKKSSDKEVSCFIGIIMQTNDTTLCSSSTDIDDCYGQLAMKKRDVSLCNNIIDSDAKDRCYDFFDYSDLKDSDKDRLSDKLEIEIGTDPHNWDTDGDSFADGQEFGVDPYLQSGCFLKSDGNTMCI